MDGFIVIDKPAGITSHGVVSAVRRAAGQKKVGHTGTLDPFATGVLPVALGEATKAIPFLDEQCKCYRAVMRLGTATDTQDYTGQSIGEAGWQHLTTSDIEQVAVRFRGSVSQLPPMFSALKRDGVPLYRLARKGEEVERAPRTIEVYSLRIDAIALPDVTFTVSCSRGTYVRTLAHDMGALLGCGAHLTSLRRLSSGTFTLEQSVTMDELQAFQSPVELEARLISPLDALRHLQVLMLDTAEAARVAQGRAPRLSGTDGVQRLSCSAGESVCLSYAGRLAAVAEVLNGFPERGEELRLLRVFTSFPFT
jgi:tRNA pseudouridine55 synthase